MKLCSFIELNKQTQEETEHNYFINLIIYLSICFGKAEKKVHIFSFIYTVGMQENSL